MRAGMNPQGVTPHTMRHTAITNFAETEANARVLQKFSGHRSVKQALKYVHARDARVDLAVEKMRKVKTKPVRIARNKARRS